MLRVNSKEIEPGDTFLALKGVVRDGHDYIEDAIDRGASCVIIERGEYPVKTITCPDTREYLVKYLKELYAEKLKKIKIIGITSDYGKTTTAYFTYQLLNALDYKCAYIGDLGFYLEDKVKDLKNTTPDLYELYELIIEAVDKDFKAIVLEVSALALHQKRIEGLNINIAALVNADAYLEDKVNLFDKVKRGGYAIINADEKNADKFMNEKKNNILFGKTATDYKISNIFLGQNSVNFKLSYEEDVEINLPFPLVYNIYNYVASYIIAILSGFTKEEILQVTPYLSLPKGRYQIFEKDGKKAIVDKASLPTEITSVIDDTRKISAGKIITLIGAKGTVDSTIRSKMGIAASNNSDYVIFTTDSPYKDSPEFIIDDMTRNITKDNYEIVLERRDAIKKGVSMLEIGDVLLVLGRGDEEEQVIENTSFPLSDISEVSKYFKK